MPTPVQLDSVGLFRISVTMICKTVVFCAIHMQMKGICCMLSHVELYPKAGLASQQLLQPPFQY